MTDNDINLKQYVHYFFSGYFIKGYLTVIYAYAGNFCLKQTQKLQHQLATTKKQTNSNYQELNRNTNYQELNPNTNYQELKLPYVDENQYQNTTL